MAMALTRYFQNIRVRRVLSALQKLIGVAALVFLGVKLYRIGWDALWAALPTHPSFYIAFAALYFVGPLADFAIYARLWGVGRGILRVLLRKRIYNEVIIDYSGEAYLYLWARRTVGGAVRGDRALLSAIKDVNLLSGAVSNAVTLLLVIAFALGGYGIALKGVDPDTVHAVMAAAGLALTVTFVVILFGRHLLGVTRDDAVTIGAIHFARLALVLVLMTVQWASALPQVPLSQWFMFLAAQMLLTRLPFLPNRDVMLMWLGVTLAPSIAAPTAHVASMFVAAGALSLLTHAIVFGASGLFKPPELKVQPA
jgi:hypothetical protein